MPGTAPKPSAPPAASLRARRFLLLPFRNVTRTAAQDWLVAGAPVMLGAALGQFSELTVVPDERLTAALRRRSLPLDVAPDVDQLRRIADETGGWTAVSGTVIASGGRLHVNLQAMDVATSKVLTRADRDIAVEGDVRPAFDSLAAHLVTISGIARAPAVDLIAQTTSSPEAYRSYLAGIEAMRHDEVRAAIDAFTNAVRLDSAFTLAWARLGLASVTWGPPATSDPTSIAYRAVERATRGTHPLPTREARLIRALQATFLGRLGAARAILDSAVAADPRDLEVREYLAGAEMRDFVMVDSTSRVPVLRGPRNEAARLLESVVDNDPGRSSAFHWLAMLYAETAGAASGQPGLPGLKRDAPSLAQLTSPFNFQLIIPVLRDSIEYMTFGDWTALPRAERRRLQMRAVEKGRAWSDRWIAASPGDPSAHWAAAQFAALGGDFDKVLRESDLAVTSQSMTPPVDIAIARARALVATGALDRAIALTDSLRAGVGVPQPLYEIASRYGVAARLLQRKWKPAWQIVDSVVARVRTQQPPCTYLASGLAQDWAFALPPAVRVAIMDSVVAGLDAVNRVDGLAECQLTLATSLAQDSAALRRPAATQRFLRAIDSLQSVEGTDADAAMLRAGMMLRVVDTAAAMQLGSRPRLLRLMAEVSVLSRFEPAAFVVAGDSVTVSWRWIGPTPARWDVPGLPGGWGLRARVLVSGGMDTTQVMFIAEHQFKASASASTGGVTELVGAVTQKGGVMVGYLPGVHMPPNTFPVYAGRVSAEGSIFRLVVRGDVAEGLRRAHPSTAQFGLQSCAPLTAGLCGGPTLPIEYH